MSFGYGFLGLLIGSFLNLCIDRLPKGESILWPRSRCESCGRELRARELVPVLSYLLLRGRCRHCGVALPARLPLVEAGTGLVFFFLWHVYGPGRELLLASLYSAILIVISGIDLEHQLIPNRLVYPASLVAIAIALLRSGQEAWKALSGGMVGLSLLWLIALLWRGGMGMGDVKLAGLAGLIVGLPGVLVALFVAFLLGGATGGVLLLARRKGGKDLLPFGPFLGLATLVTMLYGETLVSWYMRGLR